LRSPPTSPRRPGSLTTRTARRARCLQGSNDLIIGERTIEWGYFAAMSLVFALPVVVFFLIFQRFLVGGLTLGSVKG
jgi:ABC-type maltose transport system permease subunit